MSGWTWADGTAHTRSYNLRGELEAHSLGGDTRILTHDDAGRITDLANASTDVRVSYDALHRITGATSHLGTTRPPSQAFTYDANGNRLTLTEGGATETLTYAPDSNRLASVSGTPPVTVVLDAAGNTLDDGRHSYTYDDRGRLVAVDGTVTYQINALGQRVAKAAAEARLFAYDPAGQLTGEYTTTGTPVTEVIFLGDIPVAALQGASVFQVHADHLNTPRRLVAGGTVRWSWEADVFGAGSAQDDPDGDGTAVTFHWRFPGQYYDAETGHHYNYFRTYDPSNGRYLESDPIGLNGGLNTYAYVGGNPLSYVDPYGLSRFDKLFGLPKDFRNWYHRRVKQKGDRDLTKEEAKDLHAEWKKLGKPIPDSKGKQRGFVDPELFEWLVPWPLIPSSIACSELDCNNDGVPDHEEELCE